MPLAFRGGEVSKYLYFLGWTLPLPIRKANLRGKPRGCGAVASPKGKLIDGRRRCPVEARAFGRSKLEGRAGADRLFGFGEQLSKMLGNADLFLWREDKHIGAPRLKAGRAIDSSFTLLDDFLVLLWQNSGLRMAQRTYHVVHAFALYHNQEAKNFKIFSSTSFRFDPHRWRDALMSLVGLASSPRRLMSGKDLTLNTFGSLSTNVRQ